MLDAVQVMRPSVAVLSVSPGMVFADDYPEPCCATCDRVIVEFRPRA